MNDTKDIKLRKRCSIYVTNSRIAPSGYYRIAQYLPHLDLEFTVHEQMSEKLYAWYHAFQNPMVKRVIKPMLYFIVLFKVYRSLHEDLRAKPDYVIIQRALVTRYAPWFIRKALKELVRSTMLYWDFDDHPFDAKEVDHKQAELLASSARNILVTHEYLASLISLPYRQKVLMQSTTDGSFIGMDMKAVRERRLEVFKKEVRLVWVGTSGYLRIVERVIPFLDTVALKIQQEQGKRCSLTIVCNLPLEPKASVLEIINEKWTRQAAIEAIRSAHVGIMPLEPTEYALGKGGFKLIQYMAAGVPGVASAIGYNMEVLDENSGILLGEPSKEAEWVEAIMRIVAHSSDWISYSEGAYKRYECEFSFQKNLAVWTDLLSEGRLDGYPDSP